jgi:hypothetical protein
MADRETGKLLHSSASHQLKITANWQMVDGAFYSEPKNPVEICQQKYRVKSTDLEYTS